MQYSMKLFVALWLSLFFALWLLPHLALARTLMTLGSLLLTGIIADILVKLAVDLLPRKQLPDLHNKAVFITGCSSGFGLRLAKELDSLGVTVYAGLRNPLCAGAMELKQTCTSNMHVLVLDVTNDQHVRDAVNYVHNTIADKVLWAVINNAGTAFVSPVEWTPDDDFHMVWNTNTMGGVRMTKAFLPLLRKSRGRLVFVNSLSGLLSMPVSVPYAMSKFALNGFAEGLRQEIWQSGVSIHCIYPYFYRTKMLDSQRHLQHVDKLWHNMSAEDQDVFGEDYLPTLKRAIERTIVYFTLDNMDRAVADIIDATVGATPKLHYVPDWAPKLLVWGVQHVPQSLTDWFSRSITQLP